MNSTLLNHLYSTTSKVLLSQSDRINDNFERADKIITWIVGFSIGIFVLLLSQGTDNEIINGLSFKISVFALVVVILGLLFRISSFFTQIRYSTIVVGFVSFAETVTNAPEIPEIREIDENESVENLIKYLKSDFGADIKELDLSKLDETKRKEYRQLLLNYYHILSEPWDIEKQLEKFKLRYASHFGISKRQFNNYEKRIKIRGITFRIMFYLSMVLFFLTIIAFIFGTGMVLIQLLEGNCA